jgi:hypothetical protein
VARDAQEIRNNHPQPEERLMDKIILYVDDADFAREHLAQRLAERGLAPAAGAAPGTGTDAANVRHWIVVA